MSAQPAGWYPDPHQPAQLRYWDGTAWTDHRASRRPAPVPTWQPPAPLHQPPPAPPPPHVVAPVPPGPTGAWYFVITILTVGLLAAVPFFHAASRLDRPQLRKVGAVMGAGGLLGYGLMSLAPTDETGQATGVLSSIAVSICLTVVVVSCLWLIGLRREVYQPWTVTRPVDPNAGARGKVEEGRRRRAEARRVAAQDPMMARELGIGRPELRRGYDDGGLVDLNCASADQLSALCGVPRDVAHEVVAARTAIGRFLDVEDAVLYGRVSEDHAPMIRDRGIVIRDQ